MKKYLLIAAVIISSAAAALGQPRAIGMRVGATGFDVAYLHSFFPKQFLEADLGLDFGYNVNGRAGFKVAAFYNFVWATPAWTNRGDWALYAGPGLALGYVDDIMPYDFDDKRIGIYDNGFMAALSAQVGLKYTFWFPLQLAIDIRPYFGLHINDGRIKNPYSDQIEYRDSKTGFYDNGLLRFAPTLSVRYKF